MAASKLRKAFICAVLAASAGCGPSSPQELADEARRAIAAGELRTAEIHLKNLLRQQPTDAEARRLLGELSWSQGNALGAEQELRRAAELGADPAVIQLPLLRALLAQGKLDEVIEQIEAGPQLAGDDRIDALSVAGAAYRGLGEYDEAEASYRAALEEEPESAELRSELARVLLQRGQRAEGMRIVGDVLAEQPEYVPALLLRGAAELEARDYPAAEATSERVLRLTDAAAPMYSAALAQLIDAQLAQHKVDDAAVNADALLAANPRAPVSQVLKARVEVEQGALEDAERRLERVIADVSTFWQAYGLLGSINLKQDQLGQAQAYLQTAVNNQPDDGMTRLLLAELYARQGDIENARRLVVGENAVAAGDSLFFALIGRASLEAGQSELAAGYFEQSEQSAPGSPEELLGVSSVYVAAGEFDRAIRAIEASSADDALRHYLSALVRLRQGDVAAAADAARQLSELLPEAASPLTLRGIVALRAGDVAGARGLFDEALAIEPNDVGSLVNAARAAALARDSEQAAEYLRRVMELEPEHATAALGLAALSVQRRDLVGARAWLDRVPRSPERLRLEGELAIAEGRFDEAASAFERAFAVQPTFELALRAYAAASRAGRAEPEAELLVWSERDPTDVQTNFVLGTIALGRGDEDGAIRRLEAVIAADATHAGALNNLAWIYSERGDARAAALAKRAYAAQPDSAAVADTLGWILLRDGEAAEALPLLERAAAELSDQLEVKYHWAVALAETGDSAQALEVFRGILDGGEEFPGRADAVERLARLEGR